MWEDILKRNTKIDEIFIKKYEDNEPNYFEKNCLSLITEIAEFLNETKCFKYWSIKNPDKDKLKEEYADALIMTLSMFNYLNINLELVEHSKTSNILEIFNELFKDASNIMNKDTLSVKKVFSNLIYISTLLNIPEEEIKDACYKKQEIVEKRLSDDNY